MYNSQQHNIHRTSSQPSSGGGARTYRTVQNSSNPQTPSRQASRDSRYISFYSGMRSGGSSWGYTYNMK